MNSSARFNIDKTANVPTCIDIAVCCNLGVILYAELDARMPRVQLLGKIDGDVNPETCWVERYTAMSLLLHRCRVPAPSLHFRLGFLSIILPGVGIINLNRLLIMVTTLLQTLKGTPQISHFTCDSCNPQTFTFLIENKDFCANEPPFLLIIVLSHTKNAERRNVIRNSWGSIKQHKNLPVNSFVYPSCI